MTEKNKNMEENAVSMKTIPQNIASLIIPPGSLLAT